MSDNRISTKKGQASGDKKCEYNLNVNEDEFYRDNLFANYGEVATNVKKFLEKVSQNQKTKIDIKNFDDMQMAMNSLPELRKESGNASKHVDLITELTKDINSRQLLNISMLEQDIATKDNKTECYEQLVIYLRDPQIKLYDKLRLFLIFALRYEGDSRVSDLKKEVRKVQQDQNYAYDPNYELPNVDCEDLLDQLLDYAGNKRRMSK